MRLFSDFKYLLFPTRCFGCRELGYSICSQCRKLWNPHLYRSTLDSMHVYSSILYSPVAQRIILSAKEGGIKAADDLIIHAISHSLHLLLRDFEVGILVPAPSRKSSNRKRGRDFLSEITHSIARRTLRTFGLLCAGPRPISLGSMLVRSPSRVEVFAGSSSPRWSNKLALPLTRLLRWCRRSSLNSSALVFD